MTEENKTINDNNTTETNSNSTFGNVLEEKEVKQQQKKDNISNESDLQTKKIQETLLNLESKVTSSTNKVDDLSNKVTNFNTDFTTLKTNQEDELKKQEAKIKAIEEKVKEQVEASKTKILEVMGVFVALFTFISISTTTLLKFQSIYNALFFLSTFVLILISFIVLFHFILNGSLKKWLWIIVFIFPTILTVVFGILACKKNEKIEEHDNDKQVIHQINDIKMDTIISTNTVTISTNVHTYKNS